jgi:hypothetical protein
LSPALNSFSESLYLGVTRSPLWARAEVAAARKFKQCPQLAFATEATLMLTRLGLSTRLVVVFFAYPAGNFARD